MFRFVAFLTLFATVFAYGNYGSSSYSAPRRSSYGGGGGAIPAAIQSSRSIQYLDVPSTYSAPAPLNIEVGAASTSPLNMLFKSRSSDLNVAAQHIGSAGSYKATSSVDEPHRLVHTVTRPIIQEVREIVTPYRKVRQEIQPVQEQLQTLVARGASAGAGYGNTAAAGGYGNAGLARNTYGSGY